MQNRLLSNEQKLDYVYNTMKEQEARYARARWLHLLKWCIIFFIMYFIATNPTFILDRVMAVMRPFIIENVKSMTDGTKSTFLDDIKKILQENQSQ